MGLSMRNSALPVVLAAFALSFESTCECLATRKPVKRIAIIGSGISGLSAAHALTNSVEHRQDAKFECVDIFDARNKLDSTAGAGIQLNGGLSVLGKINPELQEAVWAAGLPQTGVESRCAPWFGDAAFDTLLKFDLPKIIEAAGGDVAASLIDDKMNRLWWISIMRGALQQVLFDRLPSELRVQFEKRCTNIEKSVDGCLTCKFADGSAAGNYDLVIGCEGINSVAKQYVDNRRPPNSKDAGLDKSAIYSGLRIRYAVADGDRADPVQQSATLTQHFGKGAYALSGIYGAGAGQPNAKCAFVVYLDENYIGPFKRKKKPVTDSLVQIGENADWSQDNRQTIEKGRQDMLDQLRASGITQETEIGQHIRQADRFFELGTYFHNPFGKWSSSGVVLCGDAAHALPPFLGQGSNQAIQDAYCLAEKIFAYNAAVEVGDTEKGLQEYFNEYEKMRWPSTFGIFWKAAFLGYLETGGIDGFYAKFRDTFFKTMGIVGVAKKVLLGAAAAKV